MSLSGALVGLLGGLGVLLAARGWAGTPVRSSVGRVSPDLGRLARRLAPALLVGAAVAWASRWPAAGLAVGAITAMVPMFVDAARRRAAQLAQAEALASWADMLRDTIAAHAGLQQAIVSTAAVAPGPIGPAVRRLAARTGRVPLAAALRQFASELADPVADKIVAAITIADAHQAQNLPQLLGEIAAATRRQASMRLRVDAGRAKTYASARSMVVITGAMVVVLTVGSPEFMQPYDRPAGQLVLAIVGALFVGAVWGLIAMSRPVAEPRVLAGVERAGVGE